MTKATTTLQGAKANNIIYENDNVTVLNLGLGDAVTTQPTENDKLQDARDWILFYPEGGTNRNLYLEQLALRSLRSPTHAACLNKRLAYIMGMGLTSEDEAYMKKVKNINAYGQGLTELFELDVQDTDWAGNSYVEIIKIGKEYKFYHKKPQAWRASKSKDGYWYCDDWSKVEQAGYEPIFYPAFPNFNTVDFAKRQGDKSELKKMSKVQRCIAHYRAYDPRSNHYGRPHYVSAINDIDIEYKISKYNLDEFKNGFKADMVLTFYKNVQDPDALKESKAEMKEKYTGEGKNGKFIVETVDPETGKPMTIQRVDRTTDGSFIDLQKRAEVNILKANGLTPRLIGVATAGGLGDNQQIIHEFDLFINTIAKPLQNKKIAWWTMLLDKTIGVPNEPFKVPTIPPVSKVSGIDPKLVLGIGEQRQELTYPNELPEGDELLKQTNGTSNSSTDN